MWIDAHHHLWDPLVRPQTWMDPLWPINRRFDTTNLRAAIEGTPVESAIVVQTEPSVQETVELLDLAVSNPIIAGVVGWVDLHVSVDRQLEHIGLHQRGGPLVGIRHQAESEADPAWLCTDAVAASVRSLGCRGLAYDLLVKPHQLDAAIKLARATGDTTRLVLDHCAKPPIGTSLAAWENSMRTLAEFEHVACKFSGLVTEADWERWSLVDLWPVFDVVLECFGPDRIMFGSDWPVCLLAASYAEVVEAVIALSCRLNPDEQQQIFSGTARHWYCLE